MRRRYIELGLSIMCRKEVSAVRSCCRAKAKAKAKEAARVPQRVRQRTTQSLDEVQLHRREGRAERVTIP
jgi:hypothetical protein